MVREYKKKTEGSRQNFSTSQAMVDAHNSHNSVFKQADAPQCCCQVLRHQQDVSVAQVSGEIPVNVHVGRQTAIASLHEAKLADCIKFKVMADWGYGVTSEEVKDIVQQFVVKNGLE
ncbi:hypothetical protein ElyMa_001738700, partial [Elysia marginata]